MTNRSGTEKRARDQLVNIRIDQDERDRWTEFAAAHNLPLAGLLRLSVEAMIRAQQTAELGQAR